MRSKTSSLAALPRSFFDRNALEVAPELIGCVVARRAGARLMLARIVETEAYVGEHDLACHAKAGRTPRTDPMFGEPGRAYVYFVYGIHHCLNTVCGPGGAPNAVLLRAAAPLSDDEAAEARRTWKLTEDDLSPLLHSATGPGNLCRALAVSLAQNRGDLCDAKGELFLMPRLVGTPTIWRGPRIGVDYAGEWAGELFRFCDRDDPRVSKPRPGVKRAAAKKGAAKKGAAKKSGTKPITPRRGR